MIRFWIVSFLWVTAICVVDAISGGDPTPNARLTHDMMERLSLNDMKEVLLLVRPVYDSREAVNVTVRFSLKQILDLNEKHQLLTTFWLKKYEWSNYHMSWRPEDYGGVKRMRYPKAEVWLPDIVLLECIQSHNPGHKDTKYVMVEYSGKTTLLEPVIYTLSCPVDMAQFPYDVQYCMMVWGSWEYRQNELNMVTEISEMDLSLFIEDQEWELRDGKVEEQEAVFPEGTYEDMVYTFSLKRNPTFYFRLILIPTFLLSLIMSAVYWIPPTRPDRTTVGMSVFGGFMLLLLLMVNIAPPSTGINLGTYYCTNIIFVAFSTVFTSAVVTLASKEVVMQPWFRFVMVEILGKSMGIFSQYDLMMRYNQLDSHHTGTTSKLSRQSKLPLPSARRELKMGRLDPNVRGRLQSRRDWQVVALVLDRIMFVISICTTILCMGIYFPWPKDLSFMENGGGK